MKSPPCKMGMACCAGLLVVTLMFVDLFPESCVLALCSGSGSLSEACMRLGRSCISIDISEDQFEQSFLRAQKVLAKILSDNKNDYEKYQTQYNLAVEPNFMPVFAKAVKVLLCSSN